ncbi:MAG: tetraacyldisaccharide 4'-kinase [Gammaproteobacteria bacterium]|nr:tetraacyldisaccharide 4'-kinase [Gammaproteobacteria bacterium]
MSAASVHGFLERLWYEEHSLAPALLPLSWAYRAAVGLRRFGYRVGALRRHRLPVPVIVVGGLVVGGTGKTPLTAWLSEFFGRHGYRPGIATRGYRGRARSWPQRAFPGSDPRMVGDEAVLLAQRSPHPVAADPNRARAARSLVERCGCNLILCDDGLQHLALERDLEIVVVDGQRRYGNCYCLPAGPLREPLSRLARADMIVANGRCKHGEFPMRCLPAPLRSLLDPLQRSPLKDWVGRRVHAVAGIAGPGRFFSLLRRAGLQILEHPLPDHHRYRARDIRFADNLPVIMTEKDAVKCYPYADARHWCLPLQVVMGPAFQHRLLRLLNTARGAREGEEDAAPLSRRERQGRVEVHSMPGGCGVASPSSPTFRLEKI